MEKMAEIYDSLRESTQKEKYVGDVVPLFITVDSERDSVTYIFLFYLIVIFIGLTYGSCSKR